MCPTCASARASTSSPGSADCAGAAGAQAAPRPTLLPLPSSLPVTSEPGRRGGAGQLTAGGRGEDEGGGGGRALLRRPQRRRRRRRRRDALGEELQAATHLRWARGQTGWGRRGGRHFPPPAWAAGDGNWSPPRGRREGGKGWGGGLTQSLGPASLWPRFLGPTQQPCGGGPEGGGGRERERGLSPSLLAWEFPPR